MSNFHWNLNIINLIQLHLHTCQLMINPFSNLIKIIDFNPQKTTHEIHQQISTVFDLKFNNLNCCQHE